MHINPVLLADLHDLTTPLGPTDVELAHFVQQLHRTAELAVPSLVGWTVSFTAQQQPVTMTSLHPRSCAPIGASLHVPLSRLPGFTADDRLTLYATQPGAFTTLAANLAQALQLPTALFRHDEDLQPNRSSGITGLKEASAVNQAIGVLVNRGATIDVARTRLTQQASLTNLSLYRTAKKLIGNP